MPNKTKVVNIKKEVSVINGLLGYATLTQPTEPGGMRSHAGAWEREITKNNRTIPHKNYTHKTHSAVK